MSAIFKKEVASLFGCDEASINGSYDIYKTKTICFVAQSLLVLLINLLFLSSLNVYIQLFT